MELLYAPIPSLKDGWTSLRRFFEQEDTLPLSVPVVSYADGWNPNVSCAPALSHVTQWGASDCPELLLGDCESSCALFELLEESLSS